MGGTELYGSSEAKQIYLDLYNDTTTTTIAINKSWGYDDKYSSYDKYSYDLPTTSTTSSLLNIRYNFSTSGYDQLAHDEERFFAGLYSYGNLKWGIPAGAPVAPSDHIRQMIRDRMAPAIHRSRKRQSLSIAMDIREERARQTLRRIIGEQSYRKFIRDGFITVVPKSGLTYRIFPGYGMTEVYDRGVQVDLLCVVLNGQFPPTDSLLMRYLLILNDEGEFSKYAIKHHVSPRSKLVFPTSVVPPLTEAWAKLKVA